MAQIPIIAGIYTDAAGDFRSAYPQNLIPVPKSQGISSGYLRPADGIVARGTGPGAARGAISWNGVLHRIMGNALVSVAEDGTATTLATIPGTGRCAMDYGPDRLCIAADERLFYWTGSALVEVTDPDLLPVIDVVWISGYYMVTDGVTVIVTELTDPTAVNPLKYGSAESDPDGIVSVRELKNEAYIFGRYTIEVQQNIGGDLYPFQRVDGAQVKRGAIGTHAVCEFGGTFAFVGSGRNEAPGVYLMTAGDALKISTREIDTVLSVYSETELSQVFVEARNDKAHQHLLIHLPNRCLVYDAAASGELGAPIWFTLHSGIDAPSVYKAVDLVWCYDRWNVADPTSGAMGYLSDSISSHYGSDVGWQFGTAMAYLDGNDGIIHELELVCLPGRVALGADPTVWTSHSFDGMTWSVERPKLAGKIGDRTKRLIWRMQGRIRHYRMQKFRGTSAAHLSMARLEARIEMLGTKA